MASIKNHFEEGRTILVIELVTGVVKLAKVTDVFRRNDGAGPVQFIVVDLEEIHTKFHKLPSVRGKTSFSLKDVAEISGVKKHIINLWVDEGLVKPSLTGRIGRGNTRQFSPDDLLIAVLIGSLQRNRVPPRLFQGVSDCLSVDAPAQTLN